MIRESIESTQVSVELNCTTTYISIDVVSNWSTPGFSCRYLQGLKTPSETLSPGSSPSAENTCHTPENSLDLAERNEAQLLNCLS
ncbi:hypothetical protein RRG08_033954 [Elysia crispata]|uniref:Uncharacterized protein n=1 Tax=Elysia crispata TaxID=231223 RepID=A0AAE1D3G0_9GAST|nr:hypothetical protein RRG08_033954 [Elysia crispata]